MLHPHPKRLTASHASRSSCCWDGPKPTCSAKEHGANGGFHGALVLSWVAKETHFNFKQLVWNHCRLSLCVFCLKLIVPLFFVWNKKPWPLKGQWCNYTTIGYSDQSCGCLWKKYHGIQVIMRFMRLRIHKVFQFLDAPNNDTLYNLQSRNKHIR